VHIEWQESRVCGMISRCNGGVAFASLNNRRVPPVTSSSSRVAISRLTLSRQNSLRAQSTVVGARLALRRVSSALPSSRTPGSLDSVPGKPPDATSGGKTDSDTASTGRDEADDDDVRLVLTL